MQSYKCVAVLLIVMDAKATDIVNSSEYDFGGIWHSHINSCLGR